jgi:asparagine synthase (glutamine-hydrolysing)
MLVEPDTIATTLETVRFAGEPFADPSALPTYLLSQMTRRHVTVAMSGDGGDEGFDGYRRHKVATYADRLGPLAALARPFRSKHRRLATLAQPRERRYATMMSRFTEDELVDLCEPAFLDQATAGPSPWDEILALPDARGADRYGVLDTRTYLPGAVLTKVDRMSMAHSLEVRSPLLDHEIYEYAARLPPHLKLRRGATKWLLRQLASRRGLPRDLVWRPKQGFGVPVGDWFRNEQRAWISEILLDQRSNARGYFRTERVRRLLDEHVEHRADHSVKLWSLAMLELWHRQFIDVAQQP